MIPVLLGLCLLLPLVAGLWLTQSREEQFARRLAASVAGITFFSAVGLGWSWGRAELPLDLGPVVAGEALFHVDALSATLLPYGALLSLGVLLVAPRQVGRPQLYGRVLLAEALTLGIFSTPHPLLFGLLWVLSVLLPLIDLRGRPAGRQTVRVVGLYMALSALSLVGGLVLLRLNLSARMTNVATLLLLVAVMSRKGIMPLHSWFPEIYRRGSLGGVLMLTMPQVGAYVVVRFLVPLMRGGDPRELQILSVLSLVTAAYGAAVGLVQKEVRPMLGYLAMSHSALTLAGLTGTTPLHLVGGLTVWISSGLALTGMGLTVWALEARAGTLSLTTASGRYREAPLLAGSFLFFGLASIGFPGTLGFVAEDLVASAALGSRLGTNLLIILSSAFNGIVVLRAWFMIFGGPPPQDAEPHDLLLREKVALYALAGSLLFLGIYPDILVGMWEQAAAELVHGGL
jgi:NADH-quinone oxidoreductase subunit M